MPAGKYSLTVNVVGLPCDPIFTRLWSLPGQSGVFKGTSEPRESVQMIELYSGLVEHVSAPPLAPVERPIDFEHLFRMTLGDHGLEREVLQLFDRQAAMLMERISQAEPGTVAAAAHTMKGSARGIGAWQVASAADAVEASALSAPAGLPKAIRALAVAVDDAKMVIADLLRAH